MNIQSIILLAVVIAVAGYVLYRYLHSDNKCSCCDGCSKDCCAKLLVLFLFLPVYAVAAALPNVDGNTGATEQYVTERSKYQILAYSNDSTRDVYRIPAIAKNKKGELVAIYDYRVCGTDIGFGEVDQVMRISKNNGKKWSAETKIADGMGGNDNVFGVGFGDPALCLDRESGRGVLITVSGKCIYSYGTATHRPFIARQITTDGGHTWSAPEDITMQFWGKAGSMFQQKETDDGMGIFAWAGFFGSGKILQSRITKVGNYYRLYAALLLRGTGLKGAYVVYSDDMEIDDEWVPCIFSNCICRAGYMLRDVVDSGEVFEPATVQTSFVINCSSRSAYLFALDLQDPAIIWLNLGENSMRNVAGEGDVSFLKGYLHTVDIINLRDFAQMLATEVVDDPAEADVVFSDEPPSALDLRDDQELIRSSDTARIFELLN